jgi:hypothetical protein
MKPEERFSFRVADLERLSERLASGTLEEADRALARQALGLLILILKRAEPTRISLRRLQKLLFGPRTEKDPRRRPGESASVRSTPREPVVGLPPASPQPTAGAAPSGASSTEDQQQSQPPAPGHGRLAASAYTGAQVIAFYGPALRAAAVALQWVWSGLHRAATGLHPMGTGRAGG